MAEVFDALGKPERATELRSKASTLFARFNEVFWDEELGFYAYALDGDKNKVLTVASNAGHCLWSGIVPPERAKRVMDRLTAPDMWTGWGIRTLPNRVSDVCGHNSLIQRRRGCVKDSAEATKSSRSEVVGQESAGRRCRWNVS
jgi:hypothetical protein